MAISWWWWETRHRIAAFGLVRRTGKEQHLDILIFGDTDTGNMMQASGLRLKKGPQPTTEPEYLE
jgi:hypothetical protein